MDENSPTSEADIRRDLSRVAFRMRHIRQRLAHYNEEWMSLVAERIELTDHLNLFEIDRTEQSCQS